MNELPSEPRLALANMTAQILSDNSGILAHLDLGEFSYEQDKGEGRVILDALSDNENLFRLESFQCASNQSWFS